ncbi:MAG TPA: asparagine synthase-related protein [Candidatus Acidoferrum sp.]|nr:asparagine synthase-related protein [Candidatus Acidoferrum sp.]
MKTQLPLDWSDGANKEQRAEVLSWDGRLDNRSDLLPLLADSLRGETDNAALARAVYERWGTAGFVRLIGDWSVVIRDHANRVVVLASDFAGVRPLYYHSNSGHVFWSTRLQSVVDATGISELDEDFLRGFLLFGGCPNRTPYKAIYSVPPGHAVCVSKSGTKIQRFWALPTSDEIRYRTERQYEEQLRVLFREAVTVRLQTESPVLAELSGGLDSSSVVSMANQLTRSGGVKASRLTGLSYVWKNSLDEPFIREVESFCGIDGFHISTHDVPVISETEVGNSSPEVFHPLRLSAAAAAQRIGAKVILTGQMGDLTMGNWFDDSLQVAESLRRLHIGSACHEALAWSKILRLPVYAILWKALCAALPGSLAANGIFAAPDGSYMPKSAETSLRVTNANSNPEGFCSNEWKQAPPERRKHFRNLSTILELRTLQTPECLQHLDYTHPFAHRPLVEFLMAVPSNILCRPGEPRKLMRSALPHLWPLRLQKRRSKALFDSAWQEALQPLARILLREKSLHLVERGFLNRRSVVSRLQRLSAGLDCNEGQLQHIILLEFWLRRRANGELSEQMLKAA